MSELEIIKREEYKQNRKKWMMIQIITILCVLGLALGSFIVYDRLNRTYYIEYTECSTIDYKVQYKENISFENIEFVEIKHRDYMYSSRGKEKTGRGIESRISGNHFIEFIYGDGSIKRIFCNDLSDKQITKILEFCKNKNIKVKGDNNL